MLIYNKNLSVSPVTTHVPLKLVHKEINKIKLINHIRMLNYFFNKTLKKKPKIAVTGLNPHCESNFENSEEKSSPYQTTSENTESTEQPAEP